MFLLTVHWQHLQGSRSVGRMGLFRWVQPYLSRGTVSSCRPSQVHTRRHQSQQEDLQLHWRGRQTDVISRSLHNNEPRICWQSWTSRESQGTLQVRSKDENLKLKSLVMNNYSYYFASQDLQRILVFKIICIALQTWIFFCSKHRYWYILDLQMKLYLHFILDSLSRLSQAVCYGCAGLRAHLWNYVGCRGFPWRASVGQKVYHIVLAVSRIVIKAGK